MVRLDYQSAAPIIVYKCIMALPRVLLDMAIVVCRIG